MSCLKNLLLVLEKYILILSAGEDFVFYAIRCNNHIGYFYPGKYKLFTVALDFWTLNNRKPIFYPYVLTYVHLVQLLSQVVGAVVIMSV